MEYDMDNQTYTRTKTSMTRLWIVMAFVCVVVFLSGFLIGYFATKQPNESSQLAVPNGIPKASDYFYMLQEEASEEKLADHLSHFTSVPHLAGSDREDALADYLVSQWRDFGFDHVTKEPYQVYLSAPQESRPNTITVIRDGEVEYKIEGKMKVSLDPSSGQSEDFYPFIGYSPNGTVEGDLLYVNYGLEPDFMELAKHNISAEGKIVIARQAFTIDTAAKYGAIGFISFPDVPFYAPEGTGPNETYPSKPWLSRDAVQPSSFAKYPYVGDPLTPGLPAIRGIYRKPLSEFRKTAPAIPAQPISYGQALDLLKLLKGPNVPDSWYSIFNTNFSIGPGFHGNNTKVRLEVNTQSELMTSYNVIGTISGREEPDRYVIIGNHRDSWVTGAGDASSGSAVTFEIARVLGRLRKSGWRPRRTIKFCSWGAEEWGLFGSTEWVEQNRNLLIERAVAYINLDIAVQGNFVLRTRASPMFKNVTYHWAKRLSDPVNSDKTVYETWLAHTPSDLDPTEPMIYNLFRSSDYVAFYDYIGIPSSDYGYWFGYKRQSRMYPVYHTTDDTFYWMKMFGDPGFKAHKVMAQLVGSIVLDVAGSILLPYKLTDYAHMLNISYNKVLNSNLFYGTDVVETHLRFLKEAINKFFKAAIRFDAEKDRIRLSNDTLRIRVTNDQIVQVEKAFIAPVGLPGKPYDRHVAFNFRFHNIDDLRATFPGITHEAFLALESKDWDGSRRQISMVINAVQMATSLIERVHFPQ
ncbi:predicted protein [Nematostella vectensis]|uniref:glutamate carboxypeptidase II n=1 Tax=Nematostella vectensis TaxID=45351 RepID=A7SMR7_NEMVE|nr:predicted protein [Nematostella vectensis]|eukprot:XP_001627073.1 predicted protein [Nematostella vectensis]